MKNVLSVRLDEESMERLQEQARKEGKELSAVARELIQEGWLLTMMREYRDGRLSLSTMSRKLGLSISEAIDVLAELGVRSPITYEDYLEGSAAALGLLVRDRESPQRRSGKKTRARHSRRRSEKSKRG